MYVYKNENGEKFTLIAVAEFTQTSKNDPTVKQQIKRPADTPSGEPSDGSRYGSALLNLNFLDGDDYEDFAVGAPYENEGVGAVYIYRGGQNWITDGKWCILHISSVAK